MSPLLMVLMSPFWLVAVLMGSHGFFQGLHHADNWASSQVQHWLSGEPAAVVEAPVLTIPIDSPASGDLPVDHFTVEPRRLGGAAGTFPFGAVLANLIIVVLLEACVAYCYKSGVTDKREPFVAPAPGSEWSVTTNGDFKFGLCSCLEDCQNCLHGWCCCFMRAGDTYQTAGVTSYWTIFRWGVGTYAVGQIINAIVAFAIQEQHISADTQSELQNIGTGIMQIVFAVYMAQQRVALKQTLGSQTKSSCLLECCCYYWCGFCVVCQEARQVDKINNAAPQCCCALLTTAPTAPSVAPGAVVVGQVVQAAPVTVEAKQGETNNSLV